MTRAEAAGADRALPVARSLDLGDVAISYLDWPGAGPAVVLLHATGFIPQVWKPIAERLAPARRAIAPFFCDHRPADPRQGGLAWPVLAADLVRLVQSLGLEAPAIVGHSMGATIAALAEASAGPLFEKMVLIEPIFLPEGLYDLPMRVEDHPLAKKSIKRRRRWSSRDEARAYLRSKPLFQRWEAGPLELYLSHGLVEAGDGLTLTCSPEREASLFMGSMVKNPWPGLKDIACETLVVEGGASENRFFIDLKKAAALLPRGRYLEVEGAGHLIPMERPAEIAAIIGDFLEGRDGRPGGTG